MPIEMDSDSEFKPFSQNPRNGFNLSRRVIRNQPEDPTNRHNTNKPRYTTIFELTRPTWPANDVVTPVVSERRIRELESRNDEEKLMAAFARHVINPGRKRGTGSTWVSHRSLRKAFPEHFGQTGFLPESTWKTKTAGDFGLPNLFFRSVDDDKACLDPIESVDDLVADLGQAPVLDALTAEAYQQLRSHIVTSSQRGRCLSDEGGPNTTEDVCNIPRPSKRLRSMSSAKPHSEDKTEAHLVLGSGWTTLEKHMFLQAIKPRVSRENKHSTPSRRLGLSTPNTKSLGDNNARVPSQQHSNQRLSPDLIVSA